MPTCAVSGFCTQADMREQETLGAKTETRIAGKRSDDVFLPREFRDWAGEDQVLRVLRVLVQEKHVVHLGYGVYGRTVVSNLSGNPVLFAQNGFLGPGAEKPGVAWSSASPLTFFSSGVADET